MSNRHFAAEASVVSVEDRAIPGLVCGHDSVGPLATVQFPLAMALVFGPPDVASGDRAWEREALGSALFPLLPSSERRTLLTRRLSDMRRRYGWHVGGDLRVAVADHFWLQPTERGLSAFLRRHGAVPWWGWPSAWIEFAFPSNATPTAGAQLVARLWERWRRDAIAMVHEALASAVRGQRWADAGLLAGALIRVAPDAVATASAIVRLPDTVRRVPPLSPILAEWEEALQRGEGARAPWPDLPSTSLAEVRERMREPSVAPAPLVVDPRMVGREATLEWVWRQFLVAGAREDAFAPPAAGDHVVALLGQRGVGKTTVVDAALARLQADPKRKRWNTVRWARVDDEDRPYAALVAGLLTTARLSALANASAMRGADGGLSPHTMPVEVARALELRGVRDIPPAAIAEAMQRAVRTWLKTVDPAIWIIEDLDQWDAASRAVLLHVLAQPRAAARVVLVVGGDPSGLWWRRSTRLVGLELSTAVNVDPRLEDVVVEMEEVPPLSAVAVAAWINAQRPPGHGELEPTHPVVQSVLQFSRGLPRFLQDVDLAALFVGEPLADLQTVILGRLAGLSRVARMQLGVICALGPLATSERVARALEPLAFADLFAALAELVAAEVLADKDSAVLELRHPEYARDVLHALGRDRAPARALARRVLEAERASSGEAGSLALLQTLALLLEDDPTTHLGPSLAAWEDAALAAARLEDREAFGVALRRASAAAERLGEPVDALHQRLAPALLAHGVASLIEDHRRQWEQDAARRGDRVSSAHVSVYRLRAAYRYGPRITRQDVQQAFSLAEDVGLPLATRLSALEVGLMADDDGWCVRVTPSAVERWRRVVNEAAASEEGVRAGLLLEATVGTPTRALEALCVRAIGVVRDAGTSPSALLTVVGKMIAVLRTLGAWEIADALAAEGIAAADRQRLPAMAAKLQMARVGCLMAHAEAPERLRHAMHGYSARLATAYTGDLRDFAISNQFGVSAVFEPTAMAPELYAEVVRRWPEWAERYGVRWEFWVTAHLAWAARCREDHAVLATVVPRVSALLDDAMMRRMGENAVYAAIGAIAAGPDRVAEDAFERYAFAESEWPRPMAAMAWQAAAKIAPHREAEWRTRAAAQWDAAMRALQPAFDASQHLWVATSLRLNQLPVLS